MKIVINNDYGGFSLSHEAFLLLRKMGNENALKEPDYGEKWSDGSGPREKGFGDNFCRDIPRNEPDLIKVVKKLGKRVNGGCASLKIINIPDGTIWQIEEYDGMEWIAEEHQTWG